MNLFICSVKLNLINMPVCFPRYYFFFFKFLVKSCRTLPFRHSDSEGTFSLLFAGKAVRYSSAEVSCCTSFLIPCRSCCMQSLR